MAANALAVSRLDYSNSLLQICAYFSVFRTVLPELCPSTPPSIHTSLQLEKHYIGCRTMYCSIFKTAVLVCKFLHSGNPKYFEPFVIARHSAYNTCRSQLDGMFLEVPLFASVFKSRKHFDLSFVYDTPMITLHQIPFQSLLPH